jgi:AcrR family transcriptional regulator
MAARRSAILDVARTMLTEKGVGEISLRELSDRVGLAKSNVLRYFDSREAVFLELMDEECGSWLEDLEGLLGRPRDRKPNYTNEIRVATTVADSLVARPLLCELLGSMAGVLERNISAEFAETSSPAQWREPWHCQVWWRGTCRGCRRASPTSSPRARSP